MSRTIRHKYRYFHSTIQTRAKDRLQKFHFCRLPFEVRPRNVKLNLSTVPTDPPPQVLRCYSSVQQLIAYLRFRRERWATDESKLQCGDFAR